MIVKVSVEDIISGSSISGIEGNVGASGNWGPMWPECRIDFEESFSSHIFAYLWRIFCYFHTYFLPSKVGKSYCGLSTRWKNLSKNLIFHPFSMIFFSVIENRWWAIREWWRFCLKIRFSCRKSNFLKFTLSHGNLTLSRLKFSRFRWSFF